MLEGNETLESERKLGRIYRVTEGLQNNREQSYGLWLMSRRPVYWWQIYSPTRESNRAQTKLLISFHLWCCDHYSLQKRWSPVSTFTSLNVSSKNSSRLRNGSPSPDPTRADSVPNLSSLQRARTKKKDRNSRRWSDRLTLSFDRLKSPWCCSVHVSTSWAMLALIAQRGYTSQMCPCLSCSTCAWTGLNLSPLAPVSIIWEQSCCINIKKLQPIAYTAQFIINKV